ncbi:MAG: hypothetical protein ACR2N7_06845 [Acidimicrobiia bacterium]
MTKQEFSAVVANAVADGWVVNTQTETTASLSRKPKFSWGFFILWFILFFIVGGIVYWIYWTAKKPDSMFVELTADGSVRTTHS